jgi:two-component system cell cycle response regulator DivK
MTATILVVEDFTDSRLMICSALASRGYRVLEASNGWQAVEIAVLDPPHLVLMDLRMPVLDGFETTCLMRERPSLRDIPIIAVTAYNSYEDLTDAEDVGITEYVSKPVDLDNLYELIERLLTDVN